MLASSGEMIPPWGVSALVPGGAGLEENPGRQERLYRPHNTPIPDPVSHRALEGPMVDLVEACLDVTFEHPHVLIGGHHADFGYRVVGPPRRTEPVGARAETASKTSFVLACTALSPALGIPSGSSFPFALRILRCRTGRGSTLPALRSTRSPRRTDSSAKTTSRAFTASTPAVRAPRFPRSLARSTVRKAGLVTRLNRSSNRRSGLSVAHRRSLVWIPSTLASASKSVGHRASVFAGDLLEFQINRCVLGGSLRRATGFPGLGLLRTLRPGPGPSADGEPSRRPDWVEGRANPDRFPHSPCPGRPDRRPASPLQRRRGTPQSSLTASPPTSKVGLGVTTHTKWVTRTAARPISTRLEPVSTL
jgi:hypothetical protein